MKTVKMPRRERMELALACARDSLTIAKGLKDDGVYDDFQASHIADAVNHALNAIVLMLQEDALTDVRPLK